MRHRLSRSAPDGRADEARWSPRFRRIFVDRARSITCRSRWPIAVAPRFEMETGPADQAITMSNGSAHPRGERHR